MRSPLPLVPVAALLGGCAEPSSAPRRPASPPERAEREDRRSDAGPDRRLDPTRYLGDDVERLVPRRARLASYGPVQFEPGGPALGRQRRNLSGLAVAPTLVVVDATEDLVRIVTRADVARLLLWVRRADLYWVATETSTLTLEPGESFSRKGVGVTVYPGLPLVPRDMAEDFHRVRYHDHDVVFRGWIADADFGHLYVPVDPEPPGEPGAFVNGQASVLDGPGGSELARLERGTQAVEVLGAEDGHTRIAFAGDGYRVRGFVEDSAVSKTKLGAGGGGWGYGTLGTRSGSNRIEVPPGACLLAGAGGSIVGRLLEAESLTEAAREGAFIAVDLPTPWGTLRVWLERRGEEDFRDCR